MGTRRVSGQQHFPRFALDTSGARRWLLCRWESQPDSWRSSSGVWSTIAVDKDTWTRSKPIDYITKRWHDNMTLWWSNRPTSEHTYYSLSRMSECVLVYTLIKVVLTHIFPLLYFWCVDFNCFTFNTPHKKFTKLQCVSFWTVCVPTHGMNTSRLFLH